VTRRADRAEALEQLGRSFKAAMASVRRLRGRETHRPGELSYAQYSLLFGLAQAGELPARDLAEAADLAPATVTQMLDALAAAGLVERKRSELDRRVVLTGLTERGDRVIAERRAQIEPLWERALEEVSAEELLIAASVLDRLHAMFDELAERLETEPAGELAKTGAGAGT
jgi:DNA-binding MarR family transcriptional regulator